MSLNFRTCLSSCTAASLVEARPGRGALLATVAYRRPAGDSVALHHVAPARPRLPHVSPSSVSE